MTPSNIAKSTAVFALPNVAVEIDHDAAALQPRRRHRVDVGSRIVPVVVDDLGLAVAVRIEVRTDVRQRIPLRGVLRPQRDDVVVDDAGRAFARPRERKVGGGGAHAVDDPALGRKPKRKHDVPTGIVERKAQTKTPPRANLRRGTNDALGSQLVEPPDAIVGSVVAPVRTGRAALHPAQASMVMAPPAHSSAETAGAGFATATPV